MNNKEPQQKSIATPTSPRRTQKPAETKAYSGVVWQKHLAPPPKQHPRKSPTRRCSSSVFRWRPWLGVRGLLVDLQRRVPGVSLNRVLNEAFLLWLGERSEDEWRLRVRLAQLFREEHELIQSGRVVLRSGAFLDSYAAKLIEGNEKLSVKLGRQPLGALADKKEVNVVKRLLARREAVVQEILTIQDKLLPAGEYVLKEKRSKSRRRRRDTKHKPVNNVRGQEGDVEHGEDASTG